MPEPSSFLIKNPSRNTNTTTSIIRLKYVTGVPIAVTVESIVVFKALVTPVVFFICTRIILSNTITTPSIPMPITIPFNDFITSAIVYSLL